MAKIKLTNDVFIDSSSLEMAFNTSDILEHFETTAGAQNFVIKKDYPCFILITATRQGASLGVGYITINDVQMNKTYYDNAVMYYLPANSEIKFGMPQNHFYTIFGLRKG